MRTRSMAALVVSFATICGAPAYACPTWHSLQNNTVADANQVMDNFNVTLQCPAFTGTVTMPDSAAWTTSGILSATNAIFGGTSAQVLGPSSTPVLQVLGNSGTGGSAGFANYVNSASGPQVLFFKSRSASIGTKAVIGSTDDVGGISANADDGSTSGGLTIGAMEFEEDGAVSAGNASGKIVLLTRSGTTFAERLRITSSGTIGIGTTTPDTNRLVTLDQPTNYGGIVFRVNGTNEGDIEQESTGNMYYDATSDIYLRPAGAYAMALKANGWVGIGTTSPGYTLHVNGSVAGTSAYNNLSDVRLKKNIRPIANALDMVNKLRGVRFAWRTPQERTVGRSLTLPSDSPQVGFVAQEVKSVLPEAVTVADGKDAIMSIQESKVVPVLVEAVKELKSLNDRQAERISELEHKFGRLGNERTAANDSMVHRLVLALGL